MSFYTEKIKSIYKNFKIDELNELLQQAKEDYNILPQFIDLLNKQIQEISKEEFAPLLTIKKERFPSHYEVKLLNAPINIDKYKDKIDLEKSFKTLREFIFMESERDNAIFCCEELIVKYSISRDRVYVGDLFNSNFNKWMNSIMDEICNGVSYKNKRKKHVYKEPRLLPKKMGYKIDEVSGSLEKNLGEDIGLLSDGRPYKVEVWSESGYIFVTFFFSTEDIEAIEEDEFKQLLQHQLELYKVPDEEQIKPSASIRYDESGNRLWSVTYLIREEEE